MNGDGLPDMLLTEWPDARNVQLQLYINGGDGTFKGAGNPIVMWSGFGGGSPAIVMSSTLTVTVTN